jgi:predicted RecA/RadA family phage recombinase
MAQNFIQEGHQIEFPILAAVVSGKPVLYVSKLLVPLGTATAVGTVVAHRTVGVFEIDKTTGEAWAVGTELYWNDTTKKLTTTVGSNVKVAWAVTPQIAGATSGLAKLIE